jgi:hypothetical protein
MCCCARLRCISNVLRFLQDTEFGICIPSNDRFLTQVTVDIVLLPSDFDDV